MKAGGGHAVFTDLRICRNKAVADGAVSFYLDHVVSARMARFTYGTRCNVPYDGDNAEHRKRAYSKFRRFSGEIVIPDIFSSILTKVWRQKKTSSLITMNYHTD